METFIDCFTTKNNKEILICGICERGHKNLCIYEYKAQLIKMDFTDTIDEFLLDFSLMKDIVLCSDKSVIAVGATIYQEGVINRSGGIIGNPFDQKHTNDDEMEEIKPGLFCLGFPGRIGFVFKSNIKDARILKKEVMDILDNKNEDTVKITIKKLEKITDFYFLVSDGSGKDAYPYICVRDEEGFFEKKIEN